jgi:hypothetical protein
MIWYDLDILIEVILLAKIAFCVNQPIFFWTWGVDRYLTQYVRRLELERDVETLERVQQGRWVEMNKLLENKSKYERAESRLPSHVRSKIICETEDRDKLDWLYCDKGRGKKD